MGSKVPSHQVCSLGLPSICGPERLIWAHFPPACLNGLPPLHQRSRHTGGTFLPGSQKHFSDMPLLILQATLLGELVTGTEQTGKWRHLGPWLGGAGKLSLPATCAGMELMWLPKPLLTGSVGTQGRPGVSTMEEGGPVPREKVGSISEGLGTSQQIQKWACVLSGRGPPGRGRNEQSPAPHWEAVPSNRVPPEQMNAFYRCGFEMKMQSLSH